MPDVVSIAEFDEAVATFKAAWQRADASGLAGHRVEAGLQELINAGWRPTKGER